ncbi:unnamed protein product, partial [Mesorhabditis spiculigera]
MGFIFVQKLTLEPEAPPRRQHPGRRRKNLTNDIEMRTMTINYFIVENAILRRRRDSEEIEADVAENEAMSFRRQLGDDDKAFRRVELRRRPLRSFEEIEEDVIEDESTRYPHDVKIRDDDNKFWIGEFGTVTTPSAEIQKIHFERISRLLDDGTEVDCMALIVDVYC